jgi:hypothetical protein
MSQKPKYKNKDSNKDAAEGSVEKPSMENVVGSFRDKMPFKDQPK